MVIHKANYKVMAAEAREQAKLENQLAAMQRKFEEEAAERRKMEEQNRQLMEKLQSSAVCLGRAVIVCHDT